VPPPEVVLELVDEVLEVEDVVALVELVEEPPVPGPVVVVLPEPPAPVAPPVPLVVVPMVTSVRPPPKFPGSRFSPCAQAPEFATTAKPTKATAKKRRILFAYVRWQSFLQPKRRSRLMLLGAAFGPPAHLAQGDDVRACKVWIFTATFAVVFAWAGVAGAHPVGVSSGVYAFEDGKLYAGVTLARREIANVEESKVGPWLASRLLVSIDGHACAPSFDGSRPDGDGIAIALSYACPLKTGRLDLDARFIAELERNHRHLVWLSFGDERREDVAEPGHTIVSIDMTPNANAPRRIFAPLFSMGIQHILTGFDHLLFLLGLVLVGGPLRSLVGAVTAFTVAHSITLGLAALGVWAPSPRIVEPCIALSIAYVGIDNWFARDAKGRWRVTFPFGLIHGFGFAGALREVALPHADVPIALFAFNLGVEVGQMAALAVIFPLIVLARRTAVWDRIGLRACTVAIALAGVVWFVVRLRA
jgi:hypothetical protein